MIGAGAVITKDVPDYALVVGNPGRRTGWVCQCGVKLNSAHGHTRCSACGLTYEASRTYCGLVSCVDAAVGGGNGGWMLTETMNPLGTLRQRAR